PRAELCSLLGRKARRNRLERLDEFCEALLVVERDLERACRDTRRHARDALCRRTRSADERRVDRARAARPAARSTLPRSSLSRTTGEPFRDDAAREAPTRLVVRQRQYRPRVPLAQVAPCEHPEHLLRKLQEAQPVRDRGLRAADAIRNVTQRQL